MITSVYCEEREYGVIESLASKKGIRTTLCHAGSGALESSDITGDVLIVSHSCLEGLKKTKLDASKADSIFVYLNDGIYDVEEIVKLRDELLTSNNTIEAKRINRLLSELDYFGKHELCRALPGNLQVETTSYCNAKCIMCSHYYSNNRNARFIDVGVLENMSDALTLSETISLNGLGEPFINRHVMELIDYYVSLGNRIMATTNLSIINEGLLSQIREHFDLLQISCDAASKATYESIRKGLSFDVFMNNLRLLKTYTSDVEKAFSIVVMRQNIEEMPALVNLAFEMEVDSCYFMPLAPSDIIGNANDSMDNYLSVLKYYSARALERAEQLGVNISVPDKLTIDRSIRIDDIRTDLRRMREFRLFKTPSEEDQMLERAKGYGKSRRTTNSNALEASNVACSGICEWLINRSYIDSQGNVAMCCRRPSIVMGNVNDTGNYSDIWNGDAFRQARRVFHAGHFPKACLGCGFVRNGLSNYVSKEDSPSL